MTAPDEDAPAVDDVPPQPKRRRPLAALTGAVLLLAAGLGTLGWVGWSFVGTNVVAQRAFDDTTAELQDVWVRDVDTDPEATAPPLPGGAMALIRVPAMGGSFEVPVMEGTDLSVLDHGVGHYRGTAGPGQIGNFAVTASPTANRSPACSS